MLTDRRAKLKRSLLAELSRDEHKGIFARGRLLSSYIRRGLPKEDVYNIADDHLKIKGKAVSIAVATAAFWAVSCDLMTGSIRQIIGVDSGIANLGVGAFLLLGAGISSFTPSLVFYKSIRIGLGLTGGVLFVIGA